MIEVTRDRLVAKDDLECAVSTARRERWDPMVLPEWTASTDEEVEMGSRESAVFAESAESPVPMVTTVSTDAMASQAAQGFLVMPDARDVQAREVPRERPAIEDGRATTVIPDERDRPVCQV